jgi:predicted acylesterase/phospholipase RssA
MIKGAALKFWCLFVVPLAYGCCKRHCNGGVNKFTYPEEQHQFNLVKDLNECCDDEFNVLLISGGGSYGSYGAGFINGWHETGKFPKFSVVTGVSTGALMAPHAFVGEEQDMEDLRKVYTNVDDSSIYRFRNPWEALTGCDNSIYTTAPLKDLLDRSFPNEFIDRVAKVGATGKKLYIGVTCLDSGEFEAWDMVQLAANKEYVLFRKVLLASAAVPVAFPPITLRDRLYVDGGTAASIFLYEEMLDVHKKAKENNAIKMNVYAIMNYKRGLESKCVSPTALSIAVRSLNVLLNANEEADVKTVLYLSKYHGVPFRMTYIPKDHLMSFKSSLDFNTEEMRRLFRKGAEEAKRLKWNQ